ncbi:MAG TPA: cytochrome c oxidase subunit II [Candidatus Limnocylindrales bacterium]|nr:cytochrome c oxidase subunit II [Candidatus Limnocylindrales bacterium]
MAARRQRAGMPLPRVALVALVLAPLVAGCLPTAVTSEGRAIGDLYGVFVMIAAGVFLLVYALATFAIVRYRVLRRGGGEPRQIEGNDRIEALWTAIPVLIVGGLFVGTLGVLLRTEARAASPAAEVHVHGFRWGWSFSYPSEGIEVSGIGIPGPEMVVPVGQPVRFVVTADDVVHSFFVPQFLFKRDVIPGRENIFDITVEEVGSYHGQCAEFCGVGHSAMPFTVRAVTTDEYSAWLTTARAATSSPLVVSPGATFPPAGSP